MSWQVKLERKFSALYTPPHTIMQSAIGTTTWNPGRKSMQSLNMLGEGIEKDELTVRRTMETQVLCVFVSGFSR